MWRIQECRWILEAIRGYFNTLSRVATWPNHFRKIILTANLESGQEGARHEAKRSGRKNEQVRDVEEGGLNSGSSSRNEEDGI